jgi:hypothetical protein
MTGVVDADTHIAESEAMWKYAMWKYIDEEMHPRRPILPRFRPVTRSKRLRFSRHRRS